ncbi:MAG: EamA family transporter [Alphaproteobacteria bacterium]|nr:EamA family transporter [Alphaproteobacteria bacterium]
MNECGLTTEPTSCQASKGAALRKTKREGESSLSSSSLTPTLCGVFALLLWSFGASCAVIIKEIPIFQVLTMTYLLAFSVSLVRVFGSGSWKKLKQPLYVWAIGILGLSLQQFLYLQAFRFGAPAVIDVIIYLWPVILIALGHFFAQESLQKNHVFAICLGCLSIVALKFGSLTQSGTLQIEGMIYAFASALLWALYCLFMRKTPYRSDLAVGFYYGIGAVFMGAAHLMYEPFVRPSTSEILIICFIGLVMTGSGYSLWAYGIQRGNMRVLALLSYLNPILSVLFLRVFGLATPGIEVLVACLLLGVASWIGSQKQVIQ